MKTLQLELNILDLSKEDYHFLMMQQQIDAACESMNKVRKKLFAEISELKKQVEELKSENYELKKKLGLSQEWKYQVNGSLFELSSNEISMRTA